MAGLTGRSLIAEIYRAPVSQPFDDLTLSHPALLVIQYALYRTLLSEGIQPDQVWGSSLGELIAAVAAEVWSFESALYAIIEQARLVTTLCPPGGMLAVLCEARLYDELRCVSPDISLVGINFKTHFTIAAGSATLDAVQTRLERQNVGCVRLPVGYAFHSAAIERAMAPFRHFCASLPMTRTPPLPFVSSATAGYVRELSPEHFVKAVRGPIRFGDTIQMLEQRGSGVFIDCGPSGSLAAFVKYNLSPSSNSSTVVLLSPFRQGVRNIEQLRQRLDVGSPRADAAETLRE